MNPAAASLAQLWENQIYHSTIRGILTVIKPKIFSKPRLEQNLVKIIRLS